MPTIPTDTLRALSEKARLPLARYFQRRIRGKADAEDLVQEVFVRLARTETSDAIENIDGYVCRIAANLVRDYARRRSVHKEDLCIDFEGLAEDGDFSPERILLGREAVRHMLNLLDELPQKTRAIFMLYHMEVIPQVTIARMFHMPVSTIEKHMCRANVHLRSRFEH